MLHLPLGAAAVGEDFWFLTACGTHQHPVEQWAPNWFYYNPPIYLWMYKLPTRTNGCVVNHKLNQKLKQDGVERKKAPV